MRISTLKVVYILLLLITSTALEALAQVRVQDAVISDSRSNYLIVSFNANITVSNADGFRLTGGAARIKSLVGGSGSSQLVFSLTDHVLPDDEFKLLYWPELGDVRSPSAYLKTVDGLSVSNQVSSYQGDGNIFYVSTSGNDSFKGTTPTAPFRSVDKALGQVKPGDYILLKRGDYWDRTNIIVDKSGTPNRYISLGAYGKGKQPVVHSRGVGAEYKGYALKGATISVRGDYVMIDNIHVKTDITIGGGGSDDGIQLLGCKYPVVSNCTAEGNKLGGQFGIRINTTVIDAGQEAALFNTTYPQVLNCEVFGGYRSLIGAQIWPYDGRHTIHEGGLIENCIARDIDGSAHSAWENIMVNRGNMNGFVIRKNHVYHHFASGIETFGAQNVIIEYNKIHDPLPYGMHGRGIKGGGYNSAAQTAPGIGELVSSNIIIRYNEIYNIHHSNEIYEIGIVTSNSSNGKVYGNLIYNVGANGIKVTGTLDAKGWDVYNNTVLDAGYDAIHLWTQGSYNDNVRISNNILQGKAGDIHANFTNGRATGKNNILINGSIRGNYSGEGDRKNSISSLFQDPAKHNYTLKKGAPAVDQGIRQNDYKKDITGCILNNLPDIGAFEFAVNQPDDSSPAPSPSPEPEPSPSPSPEPVELLASVSISDPTPGLHYTYYEGSWSVLPDFDKLSPVKKGVISNFDISSKEKSEKFGFVFKAYFNAPEDGQYTFFTTSDDGSKLYIHEKEVVDNDGTHAALEKKGTIGLKKGLHPIKITFFEKSGGETLSAQVVTPSGSKRVIKSSELMISAQDDNPTPEPSPEPEQPSAQAGLNYSYYEGDWKQIPDFNQLTPVKTGKVANFSLEPSQREDYFAFVFEGMIQISTAGEYTFFTNSDDGSQLFINDQKVVDNDGRHATREVSGKISLTKGLHSVRVEYLEAYSAELLEVWFQGPGISKKRIPNEILSLPLEQNPAPSPEPEPQDPTTEAGLNYKYYEGDWVTLPNFNSLNAVKTGKVSNFSLAPRNRGEMFAFVFEGSIQIDTEGEYTFYTTSDDGSQLFINNQMVVNNDGLHGPRERSGKIHLSKGLHPIRVSFFERTSGQVLEVRYSGPGVSKKLIPASKLVTANNARTSANNKKGISALSENSSELLEEEFSPALTDIIVYPNPVQSHFTINLGQSFESLSLKILDMNGRLVLERQISNTPSSVEVNLEQYYLPAGKYILSLSSAGKTIKNINLIKQ